MIAGVNDFYDEGHLIQLPDSRAQPVMSFRDLLDIIAHYCGRDVVDMMQEHTRDLELENEELEMELKDYQRTLECNGEEERELLLAIRDETESLLDLISETRINRKKVQEAAKNIYQMVNEEL